MLQYSKQSRLMKLLKIDQEYINSRGLHTEEKDDNEYLDDADTIPDKFELEKKKNLKPPKKIETFERKVRRNDKDDTMPGPNEFLPSIPFAIYLLGCVKAGKSTLAWDLIELYKNSFDEIIFISPTIKLDPTAIAMCEALNIKKQYKKLEVLQKYMAEVEKRNKNKDPKDKFKTLVIMDDCINQIKKICRKDGNFLVDLAFNRRHYGISFIMLSQYFKKVPAEFRSNFTTYALFRTENQAERKKIVEELSGFLGDDMFNYLFNEATKEPYSCLTINYGAGLQHQYTRNFNQIIIGPCGKPTIGEGYKEGNCNCKKIEPPKKEEVEEEPEEEVEETEEPEYEEIKEEDPVE